MVKLIGLKKLKTAVFISGSGSNLKNLIKFSLLKKSPIKIEYVISSNFQLRDLILQKNIKLKKKFLYLKIKKKMKMLFYII